MAEKEVRKKYASIEEIPEEILKKLEPYISNVHGNVFVIRNLPNETIGGLLARYSRAPTSLILTLVNEFLDENGNPSQVRGTEIIDRVLVSFGDESVGELEGAKVGIENVSQLLTKHIEDRRIGGSPIEQSTRYVKYDQKDGNGRWRYLRPHEVIEAGLIEKFEIVNDKSFEVYSEGVKRLTEYFKGQFSRDKFQIEVERKGEKIKVLESELENDKERKAFNTAYNFTIKCAALDVGRCVLPSSTLTHLGINGNGRFFTNLISHLKSVNLLEANQKGSELEEALNTEIPTFIKRNKKDPRYQEIDKRMRDLASSLFNGISPEAGYVKLFPRLDYMDETLASCLFPFTNISINQILSTVSQLNYEKKLEILETYRANRKNRRDRSGRGLEAGYPLTFELVGGFAEYRDLERHRILTQQRQLLTPDLGFIIPPEIIEVGLEKEVLEGEAMMSDLNSSLKSAGLLEASQYATLFNHKIRFILGMNLREFQHLSELRSEPAGHFSYRAMVQEMAKQVSEMHPWSKTFYEFVDYSDPGNKISRAKEQSRIAGKSLKKNLDMSNDL